MNKLCIFYILLLITNISWAESKDLIDIEKRTNSLNTTVEMYTRLMREVANTFQDIESENTQNVQRLISMANAVSEYSDVEVDSAPSSKNYERKLKTIQRQFESIIRSEKENSLKSSRSHANKYTKDSDIYTDFFRDDKVVYIENVFSPSGWMGDGEYGRKYIDFSGADSTKPFTLPSSVRVTYRFGPKRWAGIYWLNKPDNWGDKPGFDYTGKGISRVTFWARGSTGNEIVEFKSGDIDSSSKRFRDSFGATTGRVRLSKNWTKFDINLSGADLSSVIGGFCWVASADYNSENVITFYIDDIVFN